MATVPGAPLPPPNYIAPGSTRIGSNVSTAYISWGRNLRDEWMWQYPDLPGAVMTYQELVASREWKITGTKRGALRAVEYIQESFIENADGSNDYGFESFLKRRALDYLSVGINFYTWDDESLKYLDPTYMYWNENQLRWEYSMYNARQRSTRYYSPGTLSISKAIPLGARGFIPPLAFIMPTAIMAWLIQEHDSASADGRKIRDLLIVNGEQLADSIQQALSNYIDLYSGSDPSQIGIPIAFTENAESIAVKDLFDRIGIASIPESLNRSDFQFKWVNQISVALGLPLRYIWNSEKATNRALEEVQEARSTQRGPDAFIRQEQRLINRSGALKNERFGMKTRFSFIERVDMASQEINAKSLKMQIEALKLLVEAAQNIELDGEALIAWQQSIGSLPPDLDLIKTRSTAMSEVSSLAQEDEETVNSGDSVEKSVIPDYDEISVDQHGNVVERRSKVYSVEKAILKEVMADPNFIQEVVEDIDND